MARTQENVVSAMDSMTKTRLKAKEVETILTSAYPTASRPTRLKLSANISADDVPSSVWKRILNDKKEQKEEWDKRQSRVDRPGRFGGTFETSVPSWLPVIDHQ